MYIFWLSLHVRSLYCPCCVGERDEEFTVSLHVLRHFGGLGPCARYVGTLSGSGDCTCRSFQLGGELAAIYVLEVGYGAHV